MLSSGQVPTFVRNGRCFIFPYSIGKEVLGILLFPVLLLAIRVPTDYFIFRFYRLV